MISVKAEIVQNFRKVQDVVHVEAGQEISLDDAIAQIFDHYRRVQPM